MENFKYEIKDFKGDHICYFYRDEIGDICWEYLPNCLEIEMLLQKLLIGKVTVEFIEVENGTCD